MRPRWQEWVIGIAILGLFVTGIATLWGHEIKRLFHPDADETPAQPTAPAPPVTPPPGPAQGPF